MNDAVITIGHLLGPLLRELQLIESDSPRARLSRSSLVLTAKRSSACQAEMGRLSAASVLSTLATEFVAGAYLFSIGYSEFECGLRLIMSADSTITVDEAPARGISYADTRY